ncbi:MAG: ABC transporter permease subunit [Anaerolineaceae bacterium]|nr:ABC transporter permease subunit [Anaerolineaceae bacterium]
MIQFDYLFRKTLFSLITLAIVIVFNFLLFRILPGDPVKLLFRNPRLTKQAQETIRVQFGLDKPVWINTERLQSGDVGGLFDSQFGAYITNLLQGNLGISFAQRQSVNQILSERIWRTVLLLFTGELVAILGGMFVGIIAAWRRGTWIDSTALIIGLTTWALPTFFLGIILLVVARGSLPTSGMVEPGLNEEGTLNYWLDVGRHLILPTLTLAVGSASAYMLIMRSSVVEVLAEDYILTAKAKGLSTSRILRDHALKNAMLPMVTIIALNLGYVVGGAIQVETVFSWPGIGRLIFDSVAKQDYPVLQGAFLLLAVSVILANLITDVLYSILDPRIKES